MLGLFSVLHPPVSYFIYSTYDIPCHARRATQHVHENIVSIRLNDNRLSTPVGTDYFIKVSIDQNSRPFKARIFNHCSQFQTFRLASVNQPDVDRTFEAFLY